MAKKLLVMAGGTGGHVLHANYSNKGGKFVG